MDALPSRRNPIIARRRIARDFAQKLPANMAWPGNLARSANFPRHGQFGEAG
jgi:hypothetical protein